MATQARLDQKKERLNDGNNNGQATHGAHKHAWHTQAAWAKINNLDRIGGSAKAAQPSTGTRI